MGKKATNQPGQNITNISNKNKWRVGDCLVCGQTKIRSSYWNRHENHEANEEIQMAKKEHKIFAK
jgi:hypothetical protein